MPQLANAVLIVESSCHKTMDTWPSDGLVLRLSGTCIVTAFFTWVPVYYTVLLVSKYDCCLVLLAKSQVLTMCRCVL